MATTRNCGDESSARARHALIFCRQPGYLESMTRTRIAGMSSLALVLALAGLPAHAQNSVAQRAASAPTSSSGSPVVTWATSGTPGSAGSQAPSVPRPPAISTQAAASADSEATGIRVAVGRGIGVAVLAVGDSRSFAWSLAQALYADDTLRPSFGEAHAQVLVGEPAAAGANTELRDLADMRAAIRGEDAPSRQLLASLASSLRVRAIVLVQRSKEPVAVDGAASSVGATVIARVFLASTATFEGDTYAPDEGPAVTWRAAVLSIARTFAPALLPPRMATSAVPPPPVTTEDHSQRPFYKSPWFWGAVGAAAFGAGAVYFATRDNSPSTLHLDVQVPK